MGPWAGRALRFGIAGSFLAYAPSLSEGYGLPKLAVLALGVAAAWAALARAASRGEAVARSTPLDRPLAAAALAFAAALAASPDRFLGVVGVYSLYAEGLFAFLLCALAFRAAAGSDLPERPEALPDALVWSALAVGAVAVLQAFGSERVLGLRPLVTGRAGSTMGDPVLLGAVLAAAVPAALAAARAPSSRRRWLGRAGALAALAGTAASGSRGAFLAAGAGAAVWAALEFRERPGTRRAVLAAAALVAGIGLWGAGRAAGRSDSARLALWSALPAIVREDPLFGAGPARFQAAMRRHRSAEFVSLMGPRSTQVHAHNDVFEALATTGLLGLAAYLWLHWGALALLRARPHPASAGILAALFVQAKVNPLPLGCCVLAAAVLGSFASGERRAAAWAPPAAGAALSAAVLAGALLLASADAEFARARRAEARGAAGEARAAFAAATAANPWELFYRLEFARFLYSGGRLDEAAAQGAAAAVRRPAEADGWAMLGTYLLAWRQAGGPQDRLAEARAALETAHRLDPYAPAVNENLDLAARLAGDAR